MSRAAAFLLLALLGCGGRVVDEAPPVDDDACHELFAKLDCVAVRESWQPCCEGHDGWTRGHVVLASGATREFDARGVCNGIRTTCPL